MTKARLSVFSIHFLLLSPHIQDIGFLLWWYSTVKAILWQLIHLRSSNTPPPCFRSPYKDRKCQINKHLLVFRLICSLLNPVFSQDASHSVPGVCMSCVAWRGFLNPPGLQLTPLLIDICPFSISIATPRKMLLLQQKQKPSAGGKVSVSFQSAQACLLIRWNPLSVQLEDGSFSPYWCTLNKKKHPKKTRKGEYQLSSWLLTVMALFSAIIPPNVLMQSAEIWWKTCGLTGLHEVLSSI